jgi:cytochrome c5
MQKLVTIVSCLGAAVLLANCTPKKVTTTEMTTEQKVADVKKNFTPAQMDEGKVLFQDNCGKCHKLFDPGSRTVDKWENVLPRMAKRSKLTEIQESMVRAYLLVNAKAG